LIGNRTTLLNHSIGNEFFFSPPARQPQYLLRFNDNSFGKAWDKSQRRWRAASFGISDQSLLIYILMQQDHLETSMAPESGSSDIQNLGSVKQYL
jgi:hypothetical protein